MILSAPSWVAPGTYLENLGFLEEVEAVRSVELLFFIYDEETRGIFSREREAIAARSERFGFTVHLPDPLLPEHEALVESTCGFARSYVFHPGATEKAESLARTIGSWEGRDGKRFFLENTRLALFDAELPLFGDIGLCCDIGHLLLEGREPAPWLAAHASRIREIHLHGVVDGKDHSPFTFGTKALGDIQSFLRSFDGTLEIELFSLAEIRGAIGELEKAWVV